MTREIELRESINKISANLQGEGIAVPIHKIRLDLSVLTQSDPLPEATRKVFEHFHRVYGPQF